MRPPINIAVLYYRSHLEHEIYARMNMQFFVTSAKKFINGNTKASEDLNSFLNPNIN